MAVSLFILSFCVALCTVLSPTSANRPVFFDQFYPHQQPYFRNGPNKVIQVHHYTDGHLFDHDRYYHSHPRYFTSDFNDREGRRGDNSQLMELLLLSALMNNARGAKNQGPFPPVATAQQGGVLPGGALIG